MNSHDPGGAAAVPAGRRVVAVLTPTADMPPAVAGPEYRARALAALRRIRGEESGGAAAVIAREVSTALAAELRSVVGYSNSKSRASVQIRHVSADGNETNVEAEIFFETGQR